MDTARQGAEMNRKLTDQGRRTLDAIAGRHGVGPAKSQGKTPVKEVVSTSEFGDNVDLF